MFLQVDQPIRPQRRWAAPLLTLLCACGFVALRLTPARHALTLQWAVVPARLLDQGVIHALLSRHAWHLVSALFIHTAWRHLLSNLLFLLIFGWPAERALGPWRFLLLFLLGGAFAHLLAALSWSTLHAPIIGCSGAVSAIMGAYWALFPRASLGLVLPLGLYLQFARAPAWLLIGIWALLQILFSYVGAGFGEMAWWRHLAGFVFGIILALLWRDALIRRRRC